VVRWSYRKEPCCASPRPRVAASVSRARHVAERIECNACGASWVEIEREWHQPCAVNSYFMFLRDLRAEVGFLIGRR
jgi:hypothetical protein